MKVGVAFIRGLNFYSSRRAGKEEILERRFKEKVYVTTRSIGSLKGVLKKAEEVS